MSYEKDRGPFFDGKPSDSGVSRLTRPRHGNISEVYLPNIRAEAGRPDPLTVPEGKVYQSGLRVAARTSAGYRVGDGESVTLHIGFEVPSTIDRIEAHSYSDSAMVKSVKLDTVQLVCATTAGPSIPMSWFTGDRGRFRPHKAGVLLEVDVVQSWRAIVMSVSYRFAGVHWGINCSSPITFVLGQDDNANPESVGSCVGCVWVTECHHHECERSSAMAAICPDNKPKPHSRRGAPAKA